MKVLRSYQKDILHYMIRSQHSALFVEMRLGKTLVTVRWAKYKRDVHRLLVVAPNSALDGWFEHLTEEGEADVFDIRGEWANKAVQVNTAKMQPQISPRRWLLTNKESFLHCTQLASMNLDAIILDESPFIKNPTSQVSAFYTKHFRNVSHRIILTGTPAPESELEYFQQLYFLDPSILGFDSYWSFRHSEFIQTGYDYIMKDASQQWMGAQLAKHCYLLKREDVNLGVQKIYEVRKVDIEPKYRAVYNTLEAEFVLEYGKLVKRTIFATQKYIWMRRLCGGYIDGKLVHDAKCAALLELVQGELYGKQIVIWCNFVDELELVQDTLKKYKSTIIYGAVSVSNRRARVHMFRKGLVQFLIAQPECFRHGIDLSAADTAIYFSTPSGLETRQQSEDRIVNVKQGGVLIIDLIIVNTLEEDIIASLKAKESREKMMKRIIERCQKNKV